MYSENQAIQKKRDNVQTSALEWIINHLKALQNNIININNWIEGQTIKELTFELTFNSYYSSIVPTYMQGEGYSSDGGWSSYKTDSLQTGVLNQTMTIYPYVQVFSESITQQIASVSDPSVLTDRPVSITYFNQGSGVILADSRSLFPVMSAVSATGSNWVEFVLDIQHGNSIADLFTAGSNFIVIIGFTQTDQTGVFTIQAHVNAFASTLNSGHTNMGFNFMGRTIRFIYRYR